jgi:trk system potassium uptake protein TrkA
MNYIIIGCGRVGAELAFLLHEKGHQVAIVDQSAAAFSNLHADFRGRTVEGEALNQDVLHRAGIEQADGLATVSNSDTVNAVVAHIARTVYRVPSVVARNYDARWRSLHEVFGLQIVSSTIWGAQRLEELLYSAEIRTVFSAGNGEVDIYETAVPETWHGRHLSELLPVSQCIPVACTRAGRAMLPSPETYLERGDIIHISATLEGIEALRRKLNAAREK